MKDPFMYVVLIGMVILVFASILPKGKNRTAAAGAPELMKEMEETMEGFLAELEEDNQKLIQTMSAMRQDHENAVRKLADRVDSLERQLHEQRQEWHKLAVQRAEQQEAEWMRRTQAAAVPVSSASVPQPQVPHAEPEEEALPTESSIKGRYQELFRMHEEGKSVEYIAKKCGMNKGEVSLIIQLAEQEARKGAEQ